MAIPPHDVIKKEIAAGTEEHTGENAESRRLSKEGVRGFIGVPASMSVLKAIDPSVTDLRRADTENVREFNAMHETGTDFEEIKETLEYMQEQYEEMGMSPDSARRHAKRVLQKSKAFEDALNTSDDPDEFLALKDNFNWFADLDKSERTANLYAGGDVVEKQAAFNAYASAPEEFETTIYAAKKSKWKDTLKGGRADKMQPWMFDQKELKRGTLHEMEHTTNKKIAQEIAMDHILEDKSYYEKLERMERK